jgi:hypothetical protein
LYGRTTITEHIVKLVETKVKEAICATVSGLETVGCTTDFWEESYSKKSYLSLTLHVWPEGASELKSIVAHVMQWDQGSKTGCKVQAVLTAQMEDLQIPSSSAAFNTGMFSLYIGNLCQYCCHHLGWKFM